MQTQPNTVTSVAYQDRLQLCLFWQKTVMLIITYKDLKDPFKG